MNDHNHKSTMLDQKQKLQSETKADSCKYTQRKEDLK